MSFTPILVFYVLVFFISGLLCIPIGPVNLEIFHTSLNKRYAHALFMAIGAAFGDAVWALLAFFGMSPFSSSPGLEAGFLTVTALITLGLGLVAIKDARKITEQENRLVEPLRRTRKRWTLLKGMGMVLVNPLGVISWMVILSFLKRMHIFIPMRLDFEILFFFTVMAGAVAYFSLIVFITHKMASFFDPSRTCRLFHWIGIILILISVYFLFKAGEAVCRL